MSRLMLASFSLWAIAGCSLPASAPALDDPTVCAQANADRTQRRLQAIAPVEQELAQVTPSR